MVKVVKFLMRKIALAVVMTVLLGVSAPASIAATPKSGSVCAKLGTTSTTSGVKLICQKSGTRLLWAVATSSPSSPQAKPTPTPTATKATFKAKIPITLPVAQNGTITFSNILDHISEIPSTSYQNIQKVLSSNSPTDQPNNIYVGPNTTLDITGGTTRIKELVARESRLWSGFAQPKFYSIYAYNSMDEKDAEEKFKADFKAKNYDYSSPEVLDGLIRALAGNCQQTVHPGAFSGPVGDCRGASSGSYFKSDDSFMVLGQTGTSNDPYISSGGIIGHEYLHAVVGAQWIGSPNCVNPDNFAPGCNRSGMSNHGFSPCWIFEGAPNSIGFGLAADTQAQYLDLRKQLPYSRGATTVTDYTQASLRDYLMNQSPSTCYNNNNIYTLGYSIGALATEALVSIAGPQAVLAIYSLGAEGKDFATAFKAVYGISWDEGATVLSKVLAAEYATYGPAPR